MLPLFLMSNFVSVNAGHGHTTMQVRGQHCCGRYVNSQVRFLILLAVSRSFKKQKMSSEFEV